MVQRVARIGLMGGMVLVFSVCVFLGTGRAVSAQQSPPAAALDLQPIVAETQVEKRLKAVRERSRISVDVSLENQYPTGGDQYLKSGTTTGQVTLGGTVRYRLGGGLYAFYRRDNHDDVDGSTDGKGAGKWSYDIESDYGVLYSLGKDVHFEAAYAYTYRAYSPNAADATAYTATSKTPDGPKIERSLNLKTQYFFGPTTRVGRSFLLTAEAELFVHHLSQTIIDNPNYIKAGNTIDGQPNGPARKLLYASSLYYYLSVYGQDKVIPYVGVENSPSYDDNATQPTFSNKVRYGVLFRLSPFYQLEAYEVNDHDYPASSTAKHKTTFYTALTVHFGR